MSAEVTDSFSAKQGRSTGRLALDAHVNGSSCI